MKIRSITLFCNPGWPLDKTLLEQAVPLGIAARQAYADAGYGADHSPGQPFLHARWFLPWNLTSC